MKRVISHRIKIFSLIAIVGALLSFGAWETVFAVAGVSNYLSYQGRLTDTSGNPLGGAGTNYCFSFSVFDASSGGSKLWPTTATTTTILNVVNGVFNASIGDVSTVNFSANDTQYLNVDVAAQVGGVCTGVTWETLLPRQKLDSVAYARVAHDLYGGDAQIGTAAGVASGQNLLKLDVKTVADTVGNSGCSPNGAMWYNSGNARTLVCNNNLYQAVGSSIVNQFFDVTGPTTAVKTFTFPDASATVLTSFTPVTIAQGGTGTTTAINAFNALSPITTKGDLISNDGTNDVRFGVGTNGQFLSASSTAAAGIAWATISGGTNALLDGSSHTDTTAGTVARGDIITGQTATPKWTRLAKGTANQVLSMDGTGTDVVWATPTGGGAPGGADTQIQFNNAGAFGGSANLTFDSATNNLTFSGTDPNIVLGTITNEPAVPGAGTVVLYAKSIAGRIMPKWIGPAGVDVPAQPHVGFDKIGWWNPPGGATTVPGVLGFTAPTAVGTATARSVATTNLFRRTRRLGYVSSATAGNLSGHYNTAAASAYTMGTGSGLGGFFYIVRFGTSDAATVAGARQFTGLTSTTAAPTNVEPSTLLNSIGVGHGAADTNLKIFYGGSAAQTPIDLGANFPANTLSVDMYELILFSAPNSNNTVGYRITRLNTGNIAEGTLTAATPGTQLPASTTFLGHRAWRTNNATALAVGIDVASMYISTDY